MTRPSINTINVLHIFPCSGISYTFLKNNADLLLCVLPIIASIGVLSTIFIDTVEAHKLIDSSESNSNFVSALLIPNHTVSWAIYQQLEGGYQDGRFYQFENDKINSSLYAHITIPKLDQYKDFAPSLTLIGPTSNRDPDTFENDNQNSSENKSIPFDIPKGYEVVSIEYYQGPIPSPTFYEPFTQTSYWERQEIRTTLQKQGTYFLIVFNGESRDQEGKFSLAVGEVEDFSIPDLFILIPYSWIKLKLFFEDYLSISIAVIIFVFLVVFLPFMLVKGKRMKTTASK